MHPLCFPPEHAKRGLRFLSLSFHVLCQNVVIELLSNHPHSYLVRDARGAALQIQQSDFVLVVSEWDTFGTNLVVIQTKGSPPRSKSFKCLR